MFPLRNNGGASPTLPLNMMTATMVLYWDADALIAFILRTSDISFGFSERISAPPASLFGAVPAMSRL